MKLNSAQKKAAFNKKTGFLSVKGVKNSGKTTTAIYRSLYLNNNYCLFNEDKVLIVTPNEKEYTKIKKDVLTTHIDESFQYISMFSKNKSNIYVSTIKNLIDKYFLLYKKNCKSNLTRLSRENKKSIIQNCINKVLPCYKSLKIFTRDLKFFEEEIDWIKSEKINDLKSYQISNRKGRRLYKNSKAREALFKVFLLYTDALNNENFIDEQDKIILSINELKRSKDKFTHIIIDDSHKLTNLEIEFIKGLVNKTDYWSLTFIYDESSKINSKTLGFSLKGRSNLLKQQFKSTYIDNNTKIQKNYLEAFQYVDIKHNKSYNFIIDEYNKQQMTIEDALDKYECKNEELKSIPVYNNIAAGAPILINPHVEDNFYLPKYWLKGVENHFILKVKGDSMINADINDGDYVVIKSQYTAENRNIVAVDIDGSATLKRLKISKNRVSLLPENEKYKPIEISSDENISILGIAVGIIKSK